MRLRLDMRTVAYVIDNFKEIDLSRLNKIKAFIKEANSIAEIDRNILMNRAKIHAIFNDINPGELDKDTIISNFVRVYEMVIIAEQLEIQDLNEVAKELFKARSPGSESKEYEAAYDVYTLDDFMSENKHLIKLAESYLKQLKDKNKEEQ